MTESLANFLERDHARLDDLLSRSLEDSDIYRDFRSGLLRHIAIEEKILFPLIKELPGLGSTVATLRLHHGALGALLVPRLTPAIAHAISDILEVHNAIEEGENGIYSEVEQRAAGVDLLERAKAIADVPLSPSMDKLTDLGPVMRAMERAGFDSTKYFP